MAAAVGEMRIYQDVFFRALDILRGRRTIERLHFLRESQHWDRATLQAWQLGRMNELLREARKHVPFYAQALAGVSLPLGSLAEVAALPVLTKLHIRESFNQLQSGGISRNRFVEARTGGSTGEPTRYYWDKRGMDWNRASVYRSAEWAGVALGERTAVMSASSYDAKQARELHNRIVYFLQRYRDFPVGALTDDLLERYFADLNRFKPSSIWGYSSGVDAFARFIERRHPGARLDFVKAIITSSETLLHDQRKRIDAVFGVGTVHDNYGSREMYIGAECAEHAGYHLHSEVLYVEVVGDNNQPCRPGETGRILLTDLSNHAFPFIRYEIGDLGAMAEDRPCRCGVTLPRLARVDGRMVDQIVLKDRVLSPHSFSTVFNTLGGIVDAYQVRHEVHDVLDLYVVPSHDYSSAARSRVEAAMGDLVGRHARVNVHEVAHIAVPESGKRRFVISSVAGP